MQFIIIASLQLHIAANSFVERKIRWYCCIVITFRASRIRRKMYRGHARLCVCLSAAACLHYCTDPDVTWGSGREYPLVVHYWADLQSVAHGLRCYGNTRTAGAEHSGNPPGPPHTVPHTTHAGEDSPRQR